MLVYKVVSLEYGRFWSACTNGAMPPKYRLEYSLYQKTYPIGNSLLFAFLDSEEAVTFCKQTYCRQVFIAETTKVVKHIRPQSFGLFYDSATERLEEYWDNIDKAKKAKRKIPYDGQNPMHHPYKSTVGCTDLILQKKFFDGRRYVETI